MLIDDGLFSNLFNEIHMRHWGDLQLFLKFHARHQWVFILWSKKLREAADTDLYLIFDGFILCLISLCRMQIGINFDQPKHQIL